MLSFDFISSHAATFGHISSCLVERVGATVSLGACNVGKTRALGRGAAGSVACVVLVNQTKVW